MGSLRKKKERSRVALSVYGSATHGPASIGASKILLNFVVLLLLKKNCPRRPYSTDPKP